MSMDILKKELKSGTFRNLYLFYGPEKYLIDYYVNNIKELILSNQIVDLNYLFLEGDKATFDAINEFCESLPVMAEKKLLIIKRPSFLKSKGKGSGDSGRIVEYLSSIPEYVHIIIVENEELDKRISLYKLIEKSGLAVEFPLQSKEQLITWVKKIFKEHGKLIEQNEAVYLLDNIDGDMQSILNECMKIVSFTGDKTEITIDSIDGICTKSLNAQVFEMIDGIAQKDLQGVMTKLNDIISLKEPLVKVLVLIAKHLRVLLQVKIGLKEGLPESIICKKADIKFIWKYTKQCQNFSLERLEHALKLCAIADSEIKTSGVDERIAIEKLIIQIAK